MLTLLKTPTCFCGSTQFFKAGAGWSCGNCGLYTPPKLEKNAPVAAFQDLKGKIEHLQGLHTKLKGMITELESL